MGGVNVARVVKVSYNTIVMNDFVVIKIIFKNNVNTGKCFYIISSKKISGLQNCTSHELNYVFKLFIEKGRSAQSRMSGLVHLLIAHSFPSHRNNGQVFKK